MRYRLTLSAALASAIAVAAIAAPAYGQEAPKPAKGSVVVVLDLSPDVTENAKLRARVYETARTSGYEAERKADVPQTAQRVGAMESGKISRDDMNLQSLRAALGVTVLVRVSGEWEKGGTMGVKVSVAREGGVRSKIVEAPRGDPTAVIDATVVELLSGEDDALPAPIAAPAPDAADPGTAEGSPPPRRSPEGLLTYGVSAPPPAEEKTLEDSAVRREAWRLRGGPRLTYEVRAAVVGLLLENQKYSDVVPAGHPRAGEVERGEGDVLGIGGGVAARVGLFILPLPEPFPGHEGNFVGFRLGVGGDLAFVFVQRPIGYDYKPISSGAQRTEDIENETLLLVDIPLQVGIHAAFGRFHTASIWRGLVFGVAYTPTLQLELNMDRSIGGDAQGGPKSQTRFNYAGAELMLDIAKLEATIEGGDPEPQLRVAARVLPPLEDDWPLIVSLGVGAAWY